ncbi:hypothetical protein WS86_23725 [Burkholderia savannae]|nr:hypothetical protein WS86_23725 [Burkholderia savannae]
MARANRATPRHTAPHRTAPRCIASHRIASHPEYRRRREPPRNRNTPCREALADASGGNGSGNGDGPRTLGVRRIAAPRGAARRYGRLGGRDLDAPQISVAAPSPVARARRRRQLLGQTARRTKPRGRPAIPIAL